MTTHKLYHTSKLPVDQKKRTPVEQQPGINVPTEKKEKNNAETLHDMTI
jgi:hypothetical protein